MVKHNLVTDRINNSSSSSQVTDKIVLMEIRLVAVDMASLLLSSMVVNSKGRWVATVVAVIMIDSRMILPIFSLCSIRWEVEEEVAEAVLAVAIEVDSTIVEVLVVAWVEAKMGVE